MGMNSITYEKPADAPDVAFMTVDPQNSGTSGGEETIVGNVYFQWDIKDDINKGGFTNTGWWGTDLEYGPTAGLDPNMLFETVANGGNLNSYFSAWQQHLHSLDSFDQSTEIYNFQTKLVEAGGRNCML